jgi:hypothetical protein
VFKKVFRDRRSLLIILDQYYKTVGISLNRCCSCLISQSVCLWVSVWDDGTSLGKNSPIIGANFGTLTPVLNTTAPICSTSLELHQYSNPDPTSDLPPWLVAITHNYRAVWVKSFPRFSFFPYDVTAAVPPKKESVHNLMLTLTRMVNSKTVVIPA